MAALDRRVRDAIIERSPAILDMLVKVCSSNDKSFNRVFYAKLRSL